MTIIIVNLTQHESTPDQKLAGVIDLSPEDRARLQTLLTVPIAGPDGIADASEEAVHLALEDRATEESTRIP